MTSYLAPQQPRLFAHRGASADFPENTLPAFAAAASAGLTYLEMDVRATRDGVVVVHHDATLSRLCGDERPLAGITFAELRRLDAGRTFCSDHGQRFPYRGQGIVVPTLSEVLQAFPSCYCNIEIKDDRSDCVPHTIAAIRAAAAEHRVLLAAEHDQIMLAIRRNCGTIPTSLSFSEIAAFFAGLASGKGEAYQSSGVAMQIPVTWQGQRLVTAASIAAAHAAGLEMHVWTVNDLGEALELLRLGVDGIMSDSPQLLLNAAVQLEGNH